MSNIRAYVPLIRRLVDVRLVFSPFADIIAPISGVLTEGPVSLTYFNLVRRKCMRVRVRVVLNKSTFALLPQGKILRC